MEAKKSEPQETSVSSMDLRKLVREHMIGAFAAGLVPVPLVDIAVISGVQLNLVRKLAKRFDVPFSRNAVKGIIGALLGGVIPAYAGPPIASLAKTIPVAGAALGIISMPTLSAAATYAIGRVFIGHFESGGDLLSFNTDKARELFEQLFKKGIEKVEQIAANEEHESEVTAEKTSPKKSTSQKKKAAK